MYASQEKAGSLGLTVFYSSDDSQGGSPSELASLASCFLNSQ